MTTKRLLPAGTVLTVCAFGAYLAANLLHNRFGLDPAVAPAAVFVALLLWRRRRVFLLVAAVLIALPSFMFLRWSELIQPAAPLYFFNHLALLVGGMLAILSGVVALVAVRRAVPQP